MKEIRLEDIPDTVICDPKDYDSIPCACVTEFDMILATVYCFGFISTLLVFFVSNKKRRFDKTTYIIMFLYLLAFVIHFA